MPPLSEVERTAPCKFACTDIELLTSCMRNKHRKYYNCYWLYYWWEKWRDAYCDTSYMPLTKCLNGCSISSRVLAFQVICRRLTTNSIKQTVFLPCRKTFICLKPGCLKIQTIETDAVKYSNHQFVQTFILALKFQARFCQFPLLKCWIFQKNPKKNLKNKKCWNFNPIKIMIYQI
jgi:hypothetical protein